MTPYTIRPANHSDIPFMRPHFPRLADFTVPKGRDPADLWRGDLELLERWGAGEIDNLITLVAVNEGRPKQILGIAMVMLREEWISHAPSAHLDVLLVVKEAEGQGVGRALIAAAEGEARARGAQSMSLNCFANNERARKLYERAGFEGEVIRYFKRLG